MNAFTVCADLRPVYYDDFRCIAAGCQNSCCVNWHITFNKKDYLSLKRQSGSPELNARMKHGLQRLRKGPLSEIQYGEFVMQNGCCPLLREDSLCALQLEKGHNALPFVCRSFPRVESYQPSGYLERSLTPACEAVLDLLWNLPEGVEFRSDPLPKEKQRTATYEYEDALIAHFQEIRSHCIDILQDRRYSFPQRMLLLGLSLKELTDGETDINRWMARARALPEEVEQLLSGADNKILAMFLSNNFKVLLTPQYAETKFADIQKELARGMGVEFKSGSSKIDLPTAPYLSARNRFQERYQDKEYFMENLIVAVFFHLHLPNLTSRENLWKSYVNLCNLYSFYRFMCVMSCRDGASGNKEELFRLLVYASRGLIHDNLQQSALRDEFFQNDSATLAHMAILLGG